jgi:hypothetical protein
MAYHPAPAGTILAKKLPDAYMITRQDRHSAITCSLLPADAPTAEACIVYLSEYTEDLDNHQVSPLTLIDQFAQTQGRWFHLS